MTELGISRIDDYRPWLFACYSLASGPTTRSVQFCTITRLFGVQPWTELAGRATVIPGLVPMQGPGPSSSQGFGLYTSAEFR